MYGIKLSRPLTEEEIKYIEYSCKDDSYKDVSYMDNMQTILCGNNKLLLKIITIILNFGIIVTHTYDNATRNREYEWRFLRSTAKPRILTSKK